MKIQWLGSFLIYIGLTPLALAFGSNHSSLEPQVTSQDNSLEAIFVIKANPGLELTFDAPWTLEVSNVKHLDIADKNDLIVKDFDKSISGMRFKAIVTQNAESVSFDYKVKAFVCTKDKTRCYPQTHKGSINHSLKQPKQGPLTP